MKIKYLGILLFFTVTIAHAQNSRGSLRGVVQDATQARIASAAVVVASTSSAFTRQVAADRFGEFQFDGLAPGEYQVQVKATGFAPATATVTVSVGTVRDVSVTLNGAPLNLNPAPQERAGRVFVPLRGVFEQLGASVVYDNGTINAQKGHERSVSLHVGSTAATVDGQPQTLDVAPFIIGASTYVPLRFVSQSLGASTSPRTIETEEADVASSFTR